MDHYNGKEPVKRERPKNKIVFFLSMPRTTSGRAWSGAGDVYAAVRGRKYYPDFKEGSWSYSFGDGWIAEVRAEFMDIVSARKVLKVSKGFANYEWMIASILQKGHIEYIGK